MVGVLRMGASAAIGYLAGTLPSADIATRLARTGSADLRLAGTGNPGAVNAMHVLGTRWGYAILFADIAKGAAACTVGRRFAGGPGAHTAGTAAVVGHCYPIWNRYRGGKGVAASVGQCVATFPVYTPIDLGIAWATALSPRWKRQTYGATVVASLCWVAAASLWWRKGWPNLWGPPPTVALPLAAAATSAVILWRFATTPWLTPAPAAADPASEATARTMA